MFVMICDVDAAAAAAAVTEGFPYSKLISRTLYLQVFDYDRFSRDDPIGEVCLPLAEVDLSTTQTMWKTLQPCKGHVVSEILPVPVCRCNLSV